MKKSVLLALLGSIILACTNAGTTANGEQVDATASIDGEAVYKTYCVYCHGAKGDMGAGGAFNLKKSKLTLDERIQVIKHGRGMMAGLESVMEEGEIQAVAQFTFTLAE